MSVKFVVCVLMMFGIVLLTFAQEPIDTNSLIEEVSADTQKNAMAGYFYRLEFSRTKKNLVGKGKLVKKYEILLPSVMPTNRRYKHPLLLVYDSTKFLTEVDIISNRNEIIEELEKVENASLSEASQKTSAPDPEIYVTLRAGKNVVGKRALKIDLIEMLKRSAFSNPQELKVNGRDMISLDFRPLPKQSLIESLFYLENIEGTVLIDKLDKRIVEVEAYPLGKLAEYREQTPEMREPFRVFHYLQTRVPEGFWFPQEVTLNFMEFPDLFKGMDVRVEFLFSDYKSFGVEVKSYEVKGEEKLLEKTNNEVDKKEGN